MVAEWPAGRAQPRVLIADERGETRAWLRRALGGGYRIDELATTMETLEALDRDPPDVLIVGGQVRDLGVAELLSSARSLEESGRGGSVAMLVVLELADADRAQCLFFDADSGTLWIEGEGDDAESERTAAVGLAGFAARTGAAVSAPRAASDPRYVRDIDDPGSAGTERLLDDAGEATHVTRTADFRGGGDERATSASAPARAWRRGSRAPPRWGRERRARAQGPEFEPRRHRRDDLGR